MQQAYSLSLHLLTDASPSSPPEGTSADSTPRMCRSTFPQQRCGERLAGRDLYGNSLAGAASLDGSQEVAFACFQGCWHSVSRPCC